MRLANRHGVFFMEKNMNEYIQETIYCPKCHRKVGTYDGRSTMNKICKCKKCNKLVVYHAIGRKTEIKPIPLRNCSSGMTFGMQR
nr:MAG TPA: pre-60S ribosomal subunit biogenesis, Nmd3, peptidyl transferase.5A [Caudoviricetes sp.]